MKETMQDKIRHFMYGRYGIDALGRFCLGMTFVFLILSLFWHNAVINFLYFLFFVIYFYRSFSKNIAKRSAENSKYLVYYNKVHHFVQLRISHLRQRKTHHIYSCPNCKQKIRIPRGKGKICISCPKCHTEFIKKS